MPSKKRSTNGKVQPLTINSFLPEDVLNILETVMPDGNIVKAITHLAHSYYAVMEDQGRDGMPISFPSPPAEQGEVGADMAQRNDSTLPTIDEIERMASRLSAPNAGGPVTVRERDATTPREPSGLVPRHYILASGVPIVEDFLSNREYADKNAEARMAAIQLVLSDMPEDIWAGANIPTLVDTKYKEVKGQTK